MSNHSAIYSAINNPLNQLISDDTVLLSMSVSPLQNSRTVLVDQRLIVWLQLFDVRQVGGLCVQIKFAAKRKKGAASGQSSD